MPGLHIGQCTYAVEAGIVPRSPPERRVRATDGNSAAENSAKRVRSRAPALGLFSTLTTSPAFCPQPPRNIGQGSDRPVRRRPRNGYRYQVHQRLDSSRNRHNNFRLGSREQARSRESLLTSSTNDRLAARGCSAANALVERNTRMWSHGSTKLSSTSTGGLAPGSSM